MVELLAVLSGALSLVLLCHESLLPVVSSIKLGSIPLKYAKGRILKRHSTHNLDKWISWLVHLSGEDIEHQNPWLQ